MKGNQNINLFLAAACLWAGGFAAAADSYYNEPPLFSTGEDKDLEVVRKWARSAANRPHSYAWYLGYGGIPLCEYYLHTGNKKVLPGIQKWVENGKNDNLVKTWVNGIPAAHWVDDGSYPKSLFGLQIHKGKQTTVLWKDLRIKVLP